MKNKSIYVLIKGTFKIVYSKKNFANILCLKVLVQDSLKDNPKIKFIKLCYNVIVKAKT